ncbi:MAG: hypothetical protein H7Z13_01295 [Ferruginibacter sp.]|nr:hypothetical protein [Ferruginibacter sp.]
MCNCGNKRQQFIAEKTFLQGNHQQADPPKNKMWPDVYFEYTGSSALSVIGSITGSHYRFTQPGIVQTVDYRDSPGMMAIPVLQKVNKQ